MRRKKSHEHGTGSPLYEDPARLPYLAQIFQRSCLSKKNPHPTWKYTPTSHLMPVTEFEGLALDGDSSVCGQMRKTSQTDQRERMIINQITPLTALQMRLNLAIGQLTIVFLHTGILIEFA
jgi:hypothetical protein